MRLAAKLLDIRCHCIDPIGEPNQQLSGFGGVAIGIGVPQRLMPHGVEE